MKGLAVLAGSRRRNPRFPVGGVVPQLELDVRYGLGRGVTQRNRERFARLEGHGLRFIRIVAT